MKEKLVFGLDIGTRSVVGTVGYKKNDKFVIVAQRIKEHATRAMLDGQIHDIQKVGDTIREVKSQLEDIVDEKLTGVCIAAAGRMLCTVNSHVDMDIDNREVTQEDIFNLISAGVEKAYDDFVSENNESGENKFYCVGHSVVRYYLNGSVIGNLEGHKARQAGLDLIATFLPDDVVDSLYKAVEIAGLTVDSLTLEPIAAIGLAIPEKFRMLNLALIDVGAGTTDISITDDGCILAFGMIPMAGDALTEEIAKACLVDFTEAEKIKKEADYKDVVEYMDIMLLPQTIKAEEVRNITKDIIDKMASDVSEKIKELNGGRAVSAVFIVGGGGKIPGYSDAVAQKLGIASQRVALRGEEVMQNIVFQEETKKDSLLVTPIGICLNYYEENNNFIFVSFNGNRIKLYDNNNITVGDVAIQAQFPNDGLFPKRGDALEFTVNGKAKMIRGLPGEAAKVLINDVEATINSKIHANDVIRLIESTKGEPASATLENLDELAETIDVNVDNKKVTFPKFAMVNGSLQSKFYSIKQNDVIEILPYYTVQQILDFMDLILDPEIEIMVNNSKADKETKVYENFTVSFLDYANEEYNYDSSEEEYEVEENDSSEEENEVEENDSSQEADSFEESDSVKDIADRKTSSSDSGEKDELMKKVKALDKKQKSSNAESTSNKAATNGITVIVNNAPVTLMGKENFVFVDVFDAINFNLADSRGRNIVTLINGRQAQYMETLRANDKVDIYWEE